MPMTALIKIRLPWNAWCCTEIDQDTAILMQTGWPETRPKPPLTGVNDKTNSILYDLTFGRKKHWKHLKTKITATSVTPAVPTSAPFQGHAFAHPLCIVASLSCWWAQEVWQNAHEALNQPPRFLDGLYIYIYIPLSIILTNQSTILLPYYTILIYYISSW